MELLGLIEYFAVSSLVIVGFIVATTLLSALAGCWCAIVKINFKTGHDFQYGLRHTKNDKGNWVKGDFNP